VLGATLIDRDEQKHIEDSIITIRISNNICIYISYMLISTGAKMEAFIIFYRRKFRSQTSKAEMGRVREEKRREEERRSKRERVRRKKIQVREKVGKSRNTVFFQSFVAPEGRKVGSLKRRVRSHVVR